MRRTTRTRSTWQYSARSVAALLVAATLVLSGGCAAMPEDEAHVSPTQSATQATVEVVPVPGGDLFIAIPEDIVSYDPLQTSNEDLLNFYALMYESPFEYDTGGRLVNGLIESWDVSADGTTFTFKIREDATFSDGTPLTAHDVHESAQRALDAGDVKMPASTPSPSGSADPSASPTPRPTASSVAAAPAQRYGEYGASITSMREVDDYTLEVTVREPGNAALQFMTFPVTRADFSDTDLPVGTGPYAVVDVNEEGQITLEANPYWTGEDPYIERIVANPVSSPREQIEMQQTSLLDLVTTDAINAGNYNIAGKSKVMDYMTDYFECLVPNLSDPELGNINVRRAISEALDRRELLSTVLINHGVPTTLPISPDSFVVDTRFRSSQRDLGSALERLRASGYRYEKDGEGNVLSFELIVPDSLDNSHWKEAARAIRKQLAEVYIEVEVVALEPEEYLRRLQNGSFDMAYCSFYLSEFPDLGFLFSAAGSANYSGFYDQQVEEALIACDAAITEQQMIDAYRNLQELLNAQLPIIGLYFRMNSIICDEGLGGLQGVRAGTIFDQAESLFVTSTTRNVEVGSTPSPSPTVGEATVPDSLATPTPEHPGETSPVSSSQEGTATPLASPTDGTGSSGTAPAVTAGTSAGSDTGQGDEDAGGIEPSSEVSPSGDTSDPGSIIIPPDSVTERPATEDTREPGSIVIPPGG